MTRLSGEEPRDRAQVLVRVGNLREAGTQRIGTLVGAHRYVRTRHVRGDECHGSLELTASAVRQCRLVGAHAGAAPAGEYEPRERGRAACADGGAVAARGTHGRRSAAVRANLRRPPDLASRRTSPITMSWESALHMS